MGLAGLGGLGFTAFGIGGLGFRALLGLGVWGLGRFWDCWSIYLITVTAGTLKCRRQNSNAWALIRRIGCADV